MMRVFLVAYLWTSKHFSRKTEKLLSYIPAPPAQLPLKKNPKNKTPNILIIWIIIYNKKLFDG